MTKKEVLNERVVDLISLINCLGIYNGKMRQRKGKLTRYLEARRAR